MRHIGIFVERQRAWGRRLCEGVASFAQERGDWELATLEREDLANRRLLATFDGFVARVYDEAVSRAFGRAVSGSTFTSTPPMFITAASTSVVIIISLR